MRAVFLDRDGVINEERRDYVRRASDFQILAGVDVAMRHLAGLGWPIIVVTNQSAVGRGLLTVAGLHAIHEQLRRQVARWGGRLDAIYACTHHPSVRCACRKPRPGLLLRAARDFELSLRDSYLIGDAVTDVLAARAAGCQPILVRTGRGSQAALELERSGMAPCRLADDLNAAVMWILRAEHAVRETSAHGAPDPDESSGVSLPESRHAARQPVPI